MKPYWVIIFKRVGRETIVADAIESQAMAERSQVVQLRILKDRNLAFLHSVYSGNAKEAFDLLENDPLIPVDFTTSDGESALHLACRNQLLHLTQVLIENTEFWIVLQVQKH